ncbi:2-oxo-4-hydroxy-4-carboxy-5-ureidoimidazoline decarboxylase [Uliginosibacterium sp. 31-16]|uniref:2-oxo-4-hydroxy-4-carboxy-5-ureidoimidazoline decarboxylase n=1 Tax=Uliginosibacterium sp. 31-16 TaxID=3068315 RepID=UPI00273E276A|nr:2-oxo-4-hydroxy-4-carboxy-5-ureidoimidazoline decarboxylase [Uliginosibacterium sp. 31-16]MDP5238299.1 2-oxo-4-hydroxy-4-carboxy-5-ureidoimidazoline decarboxylase [Uliginosibacterium sp. 31-16]
MSLVPVQTLSNLDRVTFVAMLEGVFEHSPWVAERAWVQRPFADLPALEIALINSMLAASADEQLRLIRAHPELAGKAAVAGELTAESSREQAGARLDACSPAEFARLQELNAAYVARFGFPFILAVRGFDRAAIIECFAARLSNTPAQEFAEALRQIARIASLRLRERFPG